MSKRSDDAPALAGWAQNPNAPVDQRLAAAKQALNFYVDRADKLQELLELCQANWHGHPNADAALAYRAVGDRLRKILDDEQDDTGDVAKRLTEHNEKEGKQRD